MVFCNLIKGLSGFRAFSMTRFYISLIFRALHDSLSFIVIFLYSTLAFGILHYVAAGQPDSNAFYTIWQAPYQLDISNFENENVNSLEYVYFLLASIINVIIMLNLLISIIGDSFDKFRTESIELDCMEMTEFVIELENLMFWKREFNEKTYLQICQDVKADGNNDSWEGRVRAITSLITKFQEENRQNFKLIQDKIKDVDQLKAQYLSIEQKLDKIGK